jgi:hypothetical protein
MGKSIGWLFGKDIILSMDIDFEDMSNGRCCASN